LRQAIAYVLFNDLGNTNYKIVLRIYVVGVTMENVIRFGVSIEPDLLKQFDTYLKKKGYTTRSEAVRDLIRKELITTLSKTTNQEVVGTLTMIYNHHTGDLNNKLLDTQHDHHHEILTSTHIHIDHDNCLEVLVLKGKTGSIQRLADNIKALKGIQHGELVITKAVTQANKH